MTALARWRRAKEEEEGTVAKKTERRPYLTSECDNVQEAERWRFQVIRDISKSVTAIQNAGLGEFRIRDLNDHINKLLREKKHWENRIKELGGKHHKGGNRMLERDSKEAPGNRGYKYFGAARELPGVRELFESEAPTNVKKTRAELMKDVDAQYYGFRDDDDGLLVPLELQAEKDSIARLIAEFKGAKASGEGLQMEDEEDLYIREIDSKDEDEALKEAMEAGKEGRFAARVKVPTQKDIEEALLRRKKQELLEMYAIDSHDLDEFEKEARSAEKESKAEEEMPEVHTKSHDMIEDMDVSESTEAAPSELPAEAGNTAAVVEPPGEEGGGQAADQPDVRSMKVSQLKAALTEKGLDTKGSKTVLVERLEAAIRQ